MTFRPALLACAALAAAYLGPSPAGAAQGRNALTPEEAVGRQIFFDRTLSEPAGQRARAATSPRRRTRIRAAAPRRTA